jgi:hypothetical protein
MAGGGEFGLVTSALVRRIKEAVKKGKFDGDKSWK